MPITVTPDDVRAITGSTKTDAEIQPFIDAAVCAMNNVSECLTSKGITEDCQNSAAAFLASHFFVSSGVGQGSATVKRKTFEGYTIEYIIGQYSGSGIQGTSYGQTANTLTAGCLIQLDQQPSQVCFFG